MSKSKMVCAGVSRVKLTAEMLHEMDTKNWQEVYSTHCLCKNCDNQLNVGDEVVVVKDEKGILVLVVCSEVCRRRQLVEAQRWKVNKQRTLAAMTRNL